MTDRTVLETIAEDLVAAVEDCKQASAEVADLLEQFADLVSAFAREAAAPGSEPVEPEPDPLLPPAPGPTKVVANYSKTRDYVKSAVNVDISNPDRLVARGGSGLSVAVRPRESTRWTATRSHGFVPLDVELCYWLDTLPRVDMH